MQRSNEEKENMRNFIKREFGDRVTDEEIDKDIEGLFQEAYSHSEWGL